MKLLFLFLSSFLLTEAYGASCCVSNTSISNLMILPAKWQQTITMSQIRVIGDVDAQGNSVFRNNNNKETISFGKVDLSYGWTSRYQTNISLKYQNRQREFNGARAQDSGWNDIGLSHAFQPKAFERIWIYNTLNVPVAKSMYDSNSTMLVGAHGTGTYLSSLGLFSIKNFMYGDVTFNSEFHRSFARTFEQGETRSEVSGFWGGSVGVGGGYVPWRSKGRLGANLSPRLEGAKDVKSNGQTVSGKQSLVWDSSVNYTYTFDAQYALGLNYLDQTLFGPASNTLLNRSLSLVFQSRY